jgi:hypothetical protein
MLEITGWAIPLTALGIGAAVFAMAWYSSYRFDKKYGRDL